MAGRIMAQYAETRADVYLATAIRLLRLAAAAERDRGRAAAQLNDLAGALRLRYERDGAEPDLDEAIAHAEAGNAAALETGDRVLIARTRNGLGALLNARFERDGSTEDLDRAIAAVEDAGAAAEELGPEERAGVLSNLGSLLRKRAAHRRQEGDEDRALELLEQALAIARAHGTTTLYLCLHNVATARHDRFRRTRREADLERSIDAWRDALAAHGEPEHGTRFGLALVLLDSHELHPVEAAAELDEALELLEAAFAAVAPYSPVRPSYANALARALEDRVQRDGGSADLQRARELCDEACRLGLEVALESALLTAYDWGGRATRRAAWDEAAQAYTYGVRALQRLVGPQAVRAGKLAWLREGWGLAANAAYAFAKSGDPATAVAALEGARGLLLSEALAAGRFSLDALVDSPYRPLVERYQETLAAWSSITRRLRFGGPSPEPGGVEQARRAFDEAIEAIRSIPGYAGFLGYPTLADVREAAAEPLAYLVPAQAGGVALVVRPGMPDVDVVWLAKLTEERVRDHANDFVAAYRDRHVARGSWIRALDDVGRSLWQIAIGPLLDRAATERLVVIPTGLLGLLPLHAAWVPDGSAPSGRRYAIDAVVLSFASTAQALLAGRRLAASVLPSGLLAVEEPEPTRLPRLNYAKAEIAAAAAAIGSNERFAGRAATVEAVLPRLAEFPVLHFACHARSVIEEPNEGGIILASDRRLTPDGLAALGLPQARLALLSACETGVYGAAAPDEAIGLPSALQEAGVAAVVASLWEVADASTMMLVARFYELWRREGCDAAEALRGAQRWLRDTTNAEKTEHWRNAWRRGDLPEATFDAATGDMLLREPDARDFEHPVEWAAFTLTGAP